MEQGAREAVNWQGPVDASPSSDVEGRPVMGASVQAVLEVVLVGQEATP